jgi:hypothetical protein
VLKFFMDESGKPSLELRKRGAPLSNKRARGNRGGGRKTAYSPRMAVVARKCCERGMTDTEVADMLGIGLATLYRWKAEHPAFSKVFKLGKAEADDRVGPDRRIADVAIGASSCPSVTRRTLSLRLNSTLPIRLRLVL